MDNKMSQLINKHIEIAKKFIEDLRKDKDIVGVVLLGGAARGYADEYSDIDLGIFYNYNTNLVPGERIFKNFDLDIMLFEYNSWLNAKWSHEQRRAFKEGILLLDHDNKIYNLLQSKLIYGDEERAQDIINILMKLKWKGFSIEKYEIPKNYEFKLPPDLMYKRGCLECSYILLNESIDLFLQLLYCLNHEFIPDTKWRLYNSYKLIWLPENYKENITKLIKTTEISIDNLMIKVNVLNSMISEAIEVISHENIITSKTYLDFIYEGDEYRTKP